MASIVAKAPEKKWPATESFLARLFIALKKLPGNIISKKPRRLNENKRTTKAIIVEK